jgi:ABC-type antimicrobial peptide transport system permease subunit
LLLVDPPPADAGQTSRLLTRAMSDVGAAVTPTTDRLAAYNAVQNTYLAIFQALGGLGVVLGTCGLGIVVMRNVLERRRELAMMRAMGYRRPRLRRLVMTEHVLLLTIGAVVGTGAALVAVVPVWRGASAQTPTALTILGVCVLGLLSVWIASRIALRGNLQAALRHE